MGARWTNEQQEAAVLEAQKGGSSIAELGEHPSDLVIEELGVHMSVNSVIKINVGKMV